MSLEENKAIVRKWIEACNKRNLAVLDELIAPDFFHPTWQLRGPEGMKQFYAMAFKGFPDLHETIESIIAEGDMVWHRFKTTGTHKGEFRGLAPTGNKLSYMVVAIWCIVDGKCVQGWIVYDQMDFLKQLGAIEWKGFPDEVT